MSNNLFKPLGRKQNIVIQEFDNEILIYDLTTNKAFSLNQTSALVWRFSDGNKTVSDIAGSLSGRFDSPINEDFVWLALEQLKKDGLLENASEAAPDFGGLSRREVIRKVGFASLVALPVISSLVAPTAAHAQSGCTASSGRPLGCTCTANTQCVGTTTTRCCSNVPGSSRVCVTANTLRMSGQTCGNNCDCISNNCVGPTGNGTCA